MIASKKIISVPAADTAVGTDIIVIAFTRFFQCFLRKNVPVYTALLIQNIMFRMDQMFLHFLPGLLGILAGDGFIHGLMCS